MASLTIYHHIFTFTSNGLQGVVEYQVAARSRGLPDKISDELSQRVNNYKAPSALQPGEGPEAYQYVLLPDDFGAVTYFRDKGIIAGRPGNFLAHSLVFQISEAMNAGFNIFPLFALPEIAMDHTPGQNILTDDEIDISSFVFAELQRGRLTAERAFGGLAALRSLLLFSDPSTKSKHRILLADGGAKEILDLLALVFALTPLEGRPHLTFTTYAAEPARASHRFVGNKYCDPGKVEENQTWFVFGTHRPVPTVVDCENVAAEVVRRVDCLIQDIEAGMREAATAHVAHKPSGAVTAKKPRGEVTEGFRPLVETLKAEGAVMKPTEDAKISAADILAECGQDSPANLCVRVYEWGKKRDLKDPECNLSLWELGLPVAGALIAAAWRSSEAAALEMVVRAVVRSRHRRMPPALLSTLQAIIGENPDAALHRVLPADLKPLAKNIMGQNRRKLEPNGLGVLIGQISTLKASAGPMATAETLIEIRESLEDFRSYLRKLPQRRNVQTVLGWHTSGKRRLRLRGLFALGSVLMGIVLGLSIANLILTLQLQRTSDDLMHSLSDQAKKITAISQPGHPVSAAQTNPPQSAAQATASSVVGAGTKLTQQPDQIPKDSVVSRKQVQDCVRRMLDAAPLNNIKVTPMQFKNAERNIQSDTTLVLLWANLYLAYTGRTAVVDLTIPKGLPSGDATLEIIRGIQTHTVSSADAVRQLSSLPCPDTTQTK